VGVLARGLHSPTEAHSAAAKRVLRYFKGTIDMGITYSGDGSPILLIRPYVDAAFGDDLLTRQSSMGYIVFIAGGACSWKSGRLPIVTQSTGEAEFTAYTSAAKEVVWLQGMLKDLGLEVPLPTMLGTDSQVGIAMAYGPAMSQRSKHIDIRYHYVRHAIAEGSLALEYVSTERMPADGMTKALPPYKHRMFVNLLNIQKIEH
jgi:hypothetical protein